MKPEAFDNFCRNRIEQLHEVPQLEWDEKRVWNKLNIKLSKNFRIFSFTAIAFFLAVLLLVIWKYGFREGHLMADNTKKEQHSHLPSEQSFIPSLQSADSVEGVNDTAKNSLQTAVHTPVQREKQNSPLPHPGANKTLPANDSIKNIFTEVADTLTVAMHSQTDDSLFYATTIVPEKRYQNGSDVEVYSSVGPNSHSAGINYVKPLSKRFSLVYGLHTTKTYNPYFNIETHTASADAIGIQMPLQIRYYLLPQQNRLNVFLYAGLTGALPLSGVTTATYPAMRIETGAEARYRLWASKDGQSKGYVFFRMPLYNRTILNYQYNHADERIKNSHGFYLGETFR